MWHKNIEMEMCAMPRKLGEPNELVHFLNNFALKRRYSISSLVVEVFLARCLQV
jgi:hypothetical protein